MKFADHLTESAIPEWKDKYIDYKLGKKKLKYHYGKFPKDPTRIASNAKSSAVSINDKANKLNENDNSMKDSILGSSYNHYYYRDFLNSKGTNDNYTSFQKHAIKDFIEIWLISQELTKCNDFYQWLLNEAKKKFSILQSQLQIYNLQKQMFQNEYLNANDNSNLNLNIINSSSSTGGNGSCNNVGDKSSIDDMLSFRHVSLATTVSSSPNDQMSLILPNSNNNNNNCQNELYGSISNCKRKTKNEDSLGFKIKDFLKQNMLWPSWPEKSSQWRGLLTYRNSQLKRSRDQTNIQSGIHTVKETFAYDNVIQNSEITLKQAQNLLGDALLEYYLYLQMIKTFRDTNVTGFRKMVKKFDKTLQTNELDKFMKFVKDNYSIFKHVSINIQLLAQQMQQNTSNQPNTDLTATNPKDDPILWWETKIKQWYISDLTNSPSDVKKHSKLLKKFIVEYTLTEQIIHRNNRSIIQMSTACLFLGISMTLFVYILSLSFASPQASYVHKILFPLWGGWFMVLLVLFLFQIDCFIWHRNGINYRFIMLGETRTKHGTKLFNNDFATSGIPLQLYTIMFFVLWGSICAALSYKYERLIPWSYVCLCGTVLLYILPKDMIPYWNKVVSTRKWLFIRIIRLVLAPLYPVEFGDFFLGDIFCSLTYSMSDIAMFSCLVATNEKGLCGSSHSKTMGILSCLPSYWRLLQCLRRYADSGDKFPHLFNGAKYICGIAYNASLCAYRMAHRSPEARTPFIVCALINAIFTSIWDIVFDWSLLQPSKHNLFLRDDLYLAGKKNWKDGTYDGKRKLVYYIAMVWNIMVRFQWIVWAIAPSTIQQSATTSFVIAFVEVLRRFIWIIFRVENEHVANVHLFKVSSDAPLPYPVIVNPDIDIELDDYVSSDNHLIKSTLSSYRGHLDSDVSEPSSAYHPIIRRKVSMFGSFSKTIPWAHATDFQRPVITISDGNDDTRESDSDS